MRIDICADDKSDKVEEWNPSLLWEESLSEGQADGGSNPANSHYWPETGLYGGLYLVESPSTGNDGHCNEIDRVLDRRNLYSLAMNINTK